MRHIKIVKHQQRSTCFLTAPTLHPAPQPLAYTTGDNRKEAHYHFAQLPANKPVVNYVGKFYTKGVQ